MNMDLLVAILAAALAVSECLAFIPAVKSNGIFQLVVDLVKKAADLFKK